jgi:hypothetical protein
MKQRILLIVAMLLIATPAFAVVNITVTQDTSVPELLTVRYDCTSSEAVRAFALDMTLGSENDSMTFYDINDFNRGESTTPGGGYGIFPGQFALQIDPGSPDWYAEYYYPVAPPNDVDSNGQGIGMRKVIVELGTLYKDSNAPGTSGTLFTIRVDPNGKQSDTLNVVANTIRGGVILENGSAATTNLPINQPILLVTCPGAPATLTYPAADGNNGIYEVSWSAAADATGYKLDRSANAGGTWANIYTGADTTVCDDVDTGNYRYRVCSTKAGCSDSAWNTGTSDCAVVLCFPTSEPNMSNWKSLGKPRCWCYERQCLGGIKGYVEGGAKTGYYWVGVPDLDVFMAAYLVKEPGFGPGLQGEPNICASLKHYQEGGAKTGYYWVGVPDLNIFMSSYLVKEPTFGSGIGTCPAGAAGSRYTLPTDYKPCD